MKALVDTNLLVYAYDPRHRGKQRVAERVRDPFLEAAGEVHELPALYADGT